MTIHSVEVPGLDLTIRLTDSLSNKGDLARLIPNKDDYAFVAYCMSGGIPSFWFAQASRHSELERAIITHTGRPIDKYVYGQIHHQPVQNLILQQDSGGTAQERRSVISGFFDRINISDLQSRGVLITLAVYSSRNIATYHPNRRTLVVKSDYADLFE